jgi:hypothetical protein
MILDDGTSILNFELVAHEHGYNKELISEHQPSYNERYQMLRPVYEEIETYILEKWQLVNFMTLEEYKNVRIAELEGVYHQALLGDFQSLGYTFSYDDDAQKNFTKVTALFALKPEKLDTPWNTKSHGIILLTREQYLQVVEAAENHEWFNLGKLWNYKHRVEVAESYDDVDAIIWE